MEKQSTDHHESECHRCVKEGSWTRCRGRPRPHTTHSFGPANALMHRPLRNRIPTSDVLRRLDPTPCRIRSTVVSILASLHQNRTSNG